MLYVCPEIRDKLVQNRDIMFDEEKKEHYVLVDFNNV